MRLDDETYEFIKQEVIDLFERYEIQCIPISGFELAHKMGIALVSYSALSEKQKLAAMSYSQDGFFWEHNGKEYIYYNDSVCYEKSNMTILHEIGHDVLGHHADMDSDVIESEAAFFAKYAAAPPPLVHRVKPDYPEEISDLFGITYTAACNAFSYYHKWLRQHRASGIYHTYEQQLVRLFHEKMGVSGMS